MTLYSLVDEAYDVTLYKTFDLLWGHVAGLPTEGAPLSLEQGGPHLTKTSLRAHLKEGEVARIYVGDALDWEVKIRRHSA